MFEKIKNNKALKIIGNILYTILFILVVMLLIVVVIQRVSRNTIAIGGMRLFTVVSESMLPQYEIGDVLVAQDTDASELKVGDDIVYKGLQGSFKDKIITHQVVEINKVDGKYEITTKGIANSGLDPIVKEEQIYGKIIYKIQSLSFLGRMIQNIYVFYFAIFVPIALLIFRMIFNIVANMKNDKEDEDDEEDEEAIKENQDNESSEEQDAEIEENQDDEFSEEQDAEIEENQDNESSKEQDEKTVVNKDSKNN